MVKVTHEKVFQQGKKHEENGQFDRALQYYRLAAKTYDKAKQHLVILLLENHQFRNQLDEQALKAVNAEGLQLLEELSFKDNSHALLLLGQIHEQGLYGIKSQSSIAEELYLKAYRANNDSAVMALASLYTGTQQYKSAESFLIKALKIPEYQGVAKIRSGLLLVKQGQPKLAVHYFLSACQETESDLQTFGFYNCAVLYEQYDIDGVGIKQSQAKAFSYHEKAANQGNTESLFSLGWMCQNGVETNCNLEKARDYFYLRKSISQLFKESIQLEMNNSFEKHSANDPSPFDIYLLMTLLKINEIALVQCVQLIKLIDSKNIFRDDKKVNKEISARTSSFKKGKRLCN